MNNVIEPDCTLPGALVTTTENMSFEGASVDSPVAFLPKSSSYGGGPAADAPAEQAETRTGEADHTSPVPLKNAQDPTSRIGRLPAASRRPLRVPPDADVAEGADHGLQC
jgi:hypothetical protein